MWVQQLAKIGLISLNKLNTLENVVLGKLAGMMGYTQKFQEHANINQNYWNQRIAAVVRLPVFDDGENESLEDDVHSFVDETTYLTTALLRRGVGMNILLQPYSHRQQRDLLSYVTVS